MPSPSPFTHRNTTDSSEYFVFYSDPDQTNPVVVVIDLEPGSAITSGQPNHAQFPSASEAEQFALSLDLGYVAPEVPDPIELLPEP